MAHFGSPGRLADYRRQFEQTTRTIGGDPAIFATALETLAVKAFGDMGQTARLRLIRDIFIAGHSNCDLRRHLDSAPPETPIRDVGDRCRVWESHADPEYPVDSWTLVRYACMTNGSNSCQLSRRSFTNIDNIIKHVRLKRSTIPSDSGW